LDRRSQNIPSPLSAADAGIRTGKLALATRRDALAIALPRRLEKEWGKRAQLDAKLRKNGVWNVTLLGLRDDATHCPELQRVLRRVEKLLRKLPQEQTPGEWSQSIDDLLEAFGWPGDHTPNSLEFQTIEAWRNLLSSFAALDVTAPPMNIAQMVDWLHREAANLSFQAEDEGAPVQSDGNVGSRGPALRSSVDHGSA